MVVDIHRTHEQVIDEGSRDTVIESGFSKDATDRARKTVESFKALIEDNKDLASNMFDFLEAKGHVVDAAGDGITGMHLALVNQYDAIALDQMLPGMDGITLCRKLREQGGRATPVLMITARDSL